MGYLILAGNTITVNYSTIKNNIALGRKFIMTILKPTHGGRDDGKTFAVNAFSQPSNKFIAKIPRQSWLVYEWSAPSPKGYSTPLWCFGRTFLVYKKSFRWWGSRISPIKNKKWRDRRCLPEAIHKIHVFSFLPSFFSTEVIFDSSRSFFPAR